VYYIFNTINIILINIGYSGKYDDIEKRKRRKNENNMKLINY